ncbi:methyltransferase [Botrimarina mediterranea]|uniref:methyltransferase n=1 Tax=Botrimarina mediterranea TaxID=2528022 RepID=UPI003AF325D7
MPPPPDRPASTPLPLVRPDRQIVYQGATTHYDWPSAKELHDHDTITVDRVTDDIDGPAHRFLIKRGDTVEAYMSHDRFHVGEVIGISHARQEVRVAWDESLKKGGWFKVGAIYPAQEPEPTPPKNARPLSALIDRSNAENAPPGGWEEHDQTPTPYTFAEFKELWKQGGKHESFANYRSEFGRLLASGEAVIAELQSGYKAPKLKVIAANLGDWNAKQNTKQANAESIYRKMLASFLLDGSVSYSMGGSYVEAVKTKVFAVTEDQWNDHFAEVAAKREERQQAIRDPQNLADFRLFIEAKGESALCNEQMARWDMLYADLARERRAANGPSTTVTRIESDEAHSVEFVIKEGYHEKRDSKLWIVQLSDRVEKETYRELLGKAKQLGGWYSSYKKADAGFQFLSEEAAGRFTQLLDGDADRADLLAARQEHKQQTAAERLHELATEMLSRSEETIERSHDSLQNTERRAGIQAGVRGQAYAEAALARSLHSVASALSAEEATYLDGVRHRTHLEELDRVLRLAKWARTRAIQKAKTESDYGYGLRLDEEEQKPYSEEDIRFAKYPYPEVYVRNLTELIRSAANKKGCKQVSAKLAKRLPQGGPDNEFLAFRNQQGIELLADFLSRAKSVGIDCQRVADELSRYQRLQRANLGDVHELRAALREYLPHNASVRGDDPVLIAERELIGKNLPGFFPTPQPVIAEMLEYAGIEPAHTVLEPSCGKGDIVLAIEREEPQANVTAIEQNHSLAEVLAAKDIEAEFTDFLTHHEKYDRIVMNPPFEKGADILHVRHAYSCLAEQGRLVAVMSEGAFSRSDTQATEFQRWCGSLGGTSVKLPEDAFRGKESFRQTGVRTRLVVIDKYAQQEVTA